MLRHTASLPAIALASLLASSTSFAATKTWTGAVDTLWSTPGNWSPSGVPATDDALVFPGAASNKTNVFDLASALRVGTVTFSGGGYSISSGGSAVDLNGALFSSSASVGTNTWTVPLVQLSAAQTISVGSGSTLDLGGTIAIGVNTHTLTFSGAGAFNSSGVISGAGNLALSMTSFTASTLSGANTYSGTTSITSGFILIENDTALGSAAGTTTVNGGVLEVQGGITVAENLIIQGLGFLGTGALVGTGGANIWTGTVTFTGDTNMGMTAGSLEIQGIVSGPGAFGVLTASGGPILILSGLNTYTGVTTVIQGRLGVQSQGALGSPAANTVVQSGGSLEIEGVSVSNETLTLNGTGDAGAGALRTGNFFASQWHGAITLGSNSTITTDLEELTITGGISGAFGLTKEGPVALHLSTVGETYTGPTTVNGGTLDLFVALATSGVTVNNGATLKGVSTFTGTLTVNSGGTVDPGHNLGILSPGNTTFASGGTYQMQIGGTTPGTNYDQLNVTGTVSVNSNANLLVHLTGGYVPAGGETFTILVNDGADAVTGTFLGKPNNSFFAADGSEFQIAYNGSGGNDVVLTAMPPITVTITPPGPTELCGTQLLTANPTGGTGAYSISGYQWYLGGVAIMGATAQTYTASVAGSYTVTSSDPLGVTSAQSPASVLTAETVAPTVTAPTDVTVTQTVCQ